MELLGMTLDPPNMTFSTTFKRKILWFNLYYSYFWFVFTEVRLHPQQLIRVITVLIFAEFPIISQIWIDL